MDKVDKMHTQTHDYLALHYPKEALNVLHSERHVVSHCRWSVHGQHCMFLLSDAT